MARIMGHQMLDDLNKTISAIQHRAIERTGMNWWGLRIWFISVWKEDQKQKDKIEAAILLLLVNSVNDKWFY